jgi:hypothetical protein
MKQDKESATVVTYFLILLILIMPQLVFYCGTFVALLWHYDHQHGENHGVLFSYQTLSMKNDICHIRGRGDKKEDPMNKTGCQLTSSDDDVIMTYFNSLS